MTTHTHDDHTHNEDCGHTAVKHGDHVDYLVDGRLHHQEGDTVTEHVIEVSDTNPDGCKPIDAHADHQYGDGCEQE